MAPSAESILRCVELSCGYSGREVLSGVSFEVQRGEIVGLLGPNGSGKSTLLKTICRTLQPLRGQVQIQETDLRSLSPAEISRKVAYVPQEELPAFDFSSLQVVLMGRSGHSFGLFETAEDHRVARQAMDQADCSDFSDRHIAELSGGERQRVLIARALAQEAPLLLLDEPTAHVDVGHQLDIAKLLKDLAARGYAILVAVHDLNWASTLLSRCILLADGGVAMDGTPEDVLKSSRLEQAFGVHFKHLIDDEGQLRLHPSDRAIANG